MRDLKELVAGQLAEDNELRRMHLQDAVLTLITNQEERSIGLLMLRDIVNATCGFGVIAERLKSNPKAVMRMLSKNGNPTMNNLMEIIRFLVEQEDGHPEFRIAK